jgi:hypothetical protein
MTDFDASVAPGTIGELRRRLDAMGNPWSVPDRFSDDDLLPEQPPAADLVPGHVPGLHAIDTAQDLDAHLRSMPPANPFLAEHWRELGLVTTEPADDTGRGPAQQDPTWATDEDWGVG